MTNAEIRTLKENYDRRVEIRCKDDEDLEVTVLFVSDEHRDLTGELISTNEVRP
jgi:hypothetical protein